MQKLSYLFYYFFQQPEEFYFDDVFHPDIDQEQHMKLQTSFHDSKNMDPQLSPLPIAPGQRQYASGTMSHFSSLRFYNYYYKLREFQALGPKGLLIKIAGQKQDFFLFYITIISLLYIYPWASWTQSR